MSRNTIFTGFAIMAAAFITIARAESFVIDTIATSQGALQITFIGHASLVFTYKDKTIHVDPYGKLADYAKLPKADLILITHEHQDHLDTSAINRISKKTTQFIVSAACTTQVHGAMAMKNGETMEFDGLKIEAVPAYNLVHKRDNGMPFHAKGSGNGYIITFGDKRIYIAGDTENIPEMKALKNIDIAFLPMNLPYTMTPEMVADAAIAFKPHVLYPYHYGETDPSKLVELLKNEKGIEVRIRKMM